MRTSTRCSQNKWRTLMAGGIKVFLTLFLLSFFATGSYGQAGTPCTAHRWFAGDGWRYNTSSSKWEAVTLASPNLQPKGIVRCASSAETESGLTAFKGTYATTANGGYTISQGNFNNCFDQQTETRTATVNAPTPGEDIVWFNFDIRPLAGTYQFQIVTNETVGWALYYVDPAFAQPTTATGTSYPPTVDGLSGNCGQLVYADCGTSGNGWSTITVPSFTKPTNYYLAMWLNSTTETTFPGSMNLTYKSRYGCGGSTCSIQYLRTDLSCTTNGYQACSWFAGSAGQWTIQDNSPTPATSYTVSYYLGNTDGTVGAQIGTSETSASPTITLGTIPDGAVFVKICADYPDGETHSLTLVPVPGYDPGTSGYVACTSSATTGVLAGPTKPVVDASPNTQDLNLAVSNVAHMSASATGGTGTITYAWTALDPVSNTSLTFNANTGDATFTVNALIPPGTYRFKVVATDEIGCTSEETVNVNISASLEPCGIYGPLTACEGATGLVYTYGDPVTMTPYTLNTTNFAYKWTITGNGTIASEDDNTGTVTVNTNGDGSFVLTMTIDNITGILPDRTCTYTVTVNPTPDAPGAGPNARCGPGTVDLTATGCEGGTLNWYDAPTGGTLLGTGTTFTTPSISTTTSFYVSCTVGDCVSPRTEVVATVNDAPGAPTGGPNERCGPGTVSLTATGCTGTLNWYDAPSGGTSLGTGSPFTTPSISATTTFYVSCTSADGCEGPRTAVVATVNDIPVAPSGTGNFRCGPGTVSISATGCEGGTLNWYAAPSGGASIGTGSPFTTPSISATTTFYVSCTSAAGCEGPRTAVVATVYDIPATPQLTVVQPTCLITASITVASPLGAQYTYSLNGGTAQASPVFGNLAPGPYTVTVTGPGGCTSLPANATINAVPDVPAAPGAGPNHRCGPGTVDLTATGCANGTLNWYAAASGGASLGTGATFTTPSITATTTFYVSCTVGDCVSPRTAVVATVNDIPGAPSGTGNFRCGPGTVSISATGCEGGTLNWYAAPSGGASIGTGSPFTTPSISATTTFYVSCTSAAGCEGPRTAVVATVYDIPATPQLTVVQPTCLITASITVASPLGAQYTYSLNGGTAQASPVFGNLAPGPYTVTVTGPGGCTSLPANATINAVPDVPAAPGAGPNHRCGPGTVDLTATGCANGTLNWYAAASGGASLGTGATFTTPSITATTTFYVSCTVGDCVSPRTAVVATVNDIPGAPSGTGNFRCGPGTVSISATGCEGGTLNWYAAPSGGASIGTGSPFTTPSISATTTFYVSCTSAAGCEGPRTAVVATVYDIPATPQLTVVQPTCLITASITVASPLGAQYTYSLNGGTAQASPVFGNLAPGPYTVTVTGPGGCTSLPANATINAVPDVPAAPGAGPNHRCGPGTVDLTATGCANGTLNWYAAASGGASLGTGATFTTPSITATTTFYVSCSVGDCVSPRTAVVATVNDIPVAPTGGPNARCGTGTVVLTASGCTGTLNWYAAPSGGASIGTGSPFTTPSISATTTFYVSCTSAAGCEGPRTAVVATVNSLGAVTATPSPTTCGLNNGSFTITSPLGADITYSVDGGSFVSQTTFSNLPGGTYSIVAHSTAGCSSSGTVIVGTSTTLGAVTANATPTTCGLPNGSITVTAPLGADITYKLNNGTPQSSPTFSNLPAGMYNITAMSTAGCTSSGSATVGTSTTLGAVTANATPTTCGLPNGSITVTAPLGADITYKLNNGTPQSSPTFSNLPAGMYNITAMSTAGCTSSGSATVGTSTTLGAVTANATPTTCGLPNGSITVTAPLGADITYKLNNGTPQSSPTFSNLPAGMYNITAMSTAGCTSSGSATVGTSSILGAVIANGTPTTCGLNNGSIVISAPVGAGITYSLNGGTPQTSTTFSNLPAGTYSILARSTAGCTSSGSATVGGSQPCLTYCSYTQGFWGNKNGLKMLPALLSQPIVIGKAGYFTFTIPAGSATMLNNAMPGGNTPTKLTSTCTMTTDKNGCFMKNYATKQGRFNNVLLSQTITLTLNTRLAGNPLLTLPIQSGCLVTGMGSFPMNQSVVNYLTYNGASATVADLLTLANDLLSGYLTPGSNVGTPSKPRIVPSYSAVNDAVDAINNAFDGCTSFNGYQECVTSSMVVLARVAPEANTISDHVKVSAYPNPFTDKVRFTIKSSVSGQGSLDVFNMVGQKVKTVYQGYVHANTEQVVEYRVPDVSRQNLIFVMTVNGERVTGKLLNAKE